jgi:hypothetical protein
MLLMIAVKVVSIATPKRARSVQVRGAGLVEYTTEYLFRDLWLRSDLAPRDRSLVTVATPIASGRVAQITYRLNRAMDNELTQDRPPKSSYTWPSTRVGPMMERMSGR